MKLVICVSAVLGLCSTVVMAQLTGPTTGQGNPSQDCAPFSTCEEYRKFVDQGGQSGGATTTRQPPDARARQLTPFDVRSPADIRNAIGEHRIQGPRF